ncbi:uncharacterized protein CTRU02_210461 [Colletotrichum truncatum]|uniref:Uncharacterized protein n=1 Tax=Colletotrichum truncatum TaxID=5467 RepID=A0ACC3YR86_COLTU|nr:uncharacterized protein CTRU02_13937 [Colletotrichum truncatum]KAF6782780.1 hypothetical protein CTRU02_13937 [Colletotrichum truncatum]
MLLSRIALLLSSATVLVAQTVDWRAAKCEGVVVDAKALPNRRWEAANATAALHEMIAAWKEYDSKPNEVKFEFSEFASWFLGGPELWRCTKLLDVPCSTSLTCQDTKFPAGHLILNSFSKLHQFHRRYFEALDQAQMEIQSEMDLFAEKFSVPLPDDGSSEKFQRIMLNVIYGMVGIAQAYTNNIFVYSSMFQGFFGLTQTMRSQITTTSSYSIFTSWAIGKDFILPGDKPKPAYGRLSAVMGGIFDSWKASEVEYLRRIFTPRDNDTVNYLVAALDNGLMSATPDDLDFKEMSKVIKKLFYPNLMLTAWQTVPSARRPFILKTNLPCKMRKKERSSVLWPMLPADSHERAATCYNGSLFYLLDIRNEGVSVSFSNPSIGVSENNPFTALFGTETMDGKAWGGVTKEDIVAAVYGGWLAGGRQNNNFDLNYTNIQPEEGSELWFGNGVRMPGYVKMPLCMNTYTIYGNLAVGKPDDDPSWPCASLPVLRPS